MDSTEKELPGLRGKKIIFWEEPRISRELEIALTRAGAEAISYPYKRPDNFPEWIQGKNLKPDCIALHIPIVTEQNSSQALQLGRKLMSLGRVVLLKSGSSNEQVDKPTASVYKTLEGEGATTVWARYSLKSIIRDIAEVLQKNVADKI